MSDPRWYFTEEQLANSPSRKCGINAELELSYRQRAANLIQEMGQRLQVSQLCINTAIVYMHRFYAFHSFTMFHRNSIAAAAFFLAAKVEEQPRKLEHVIKILNICLEKTDMTRETYAEQAQELVLNENILLQTLGFDVAIDHPHTHVVKACQLFNIVTVSRELRQTCYFMASNSLHLTTMCLKYRPTVVAAFCIYIACKWSRWEIPDSSEGKAWYSYVDETVTLDTLKRLTEEYLQILERSPSKFKSKMKAITSNGQAGVRIVQNALSKVNQSPSITDVPSTSHNHKTQHHDKHHHHHHHKNASMSNNAGTSSMNVNANGNSRSSSNSNSSTKGQMHQMPNSTSSSSQQYKQASTASSTTIQPPLPPTASSSNHNMHRQRPSSSSSQQQQQTYTSSNNNQPKPPLIDERTHQQQRLMHQDGSFYNSSSSTSTQRMSDHSKHRNMISSNTTVPPPPPPQQNPPLPPPQQQQQQQQQPYMKLNSMNDQKQQHNMMANNSKQPPSYPVQGGMDLHQKNLKQSSSTDYHNRNNAMNQQIPNNPQKKPSWPQQTQQQSSSSMSQQQMQQESHNQGKQYPHLQKNLQQIPNSVNVLDQSASNMLNTSKSSLSAYNEMSSKQQQQQQHTANISQNDFWFNDKINEMSNKTTTPPRQGKSLFSPSPEHDSGTNEKAKYMLMTGSLKRSNENAVDSPKEDKKSSTPTKRDSKSMHANQSGQSQKQLNPSSNQMDNKKFSKIDSNLSTSSLNPENITDSSQMVKKRSYTSIKDSLDATHNRENKIRKVDQVKLEPVVPSSLPVTPSQTNNSSKNPHSLSQPPSIYGGTMTEMPTPVPSKQPIETNPDIVKSLLQECFSSSKYDLYDSPLDVINPEPPEELLATTHVVSNNSVNVNNQPQQTNMIKQESLDDLLDIKDEKLDSSAGESSRKDKKKSKKKKEKHKHKKKHKSSDREDKSDSSSLKIIFSKDSKTDIKSSPESFGGGLKIKIPINKDAGKIDMNQLQQQQQQAQQQQQNPAPIKLKISKEKFGSFTNLNSNTNNNNNNNNNSSSHQHHKSKKDKDKEKDREKSKSKSSKHYNSSDYKESSSYQHSN